MESGDATREQQAAAANEAREAERRVAVTQGARRAPVLDPRARRATLRLPGRGGQTPVRGQKRPREDQVSASTPPVPQETETRPRPSPPRQASGAAGGSAATPNRAAVRPSRGSDSGDREAARSGSTPDLGGQGEIDFTRAGEATRLRLIREVCARWGLRAAEGTGPSTISSEEILVSQAYAVTMKRMAEGHRNEYLISRLRKRLEQQQAEKAAWEKEKAGVAAERAAWEEERAAMCAEKQELMRQLERAQAEAVANAERAARAEEKAERRGRKRGLEEARDFFRKMLITLTDDFADDGYFNAYLDFVQKREKVREEGGDPEAVEFPLPPGGDAENEAVGEDEVVAEDGVAAEDEAVAEDNPVPATP